MSWLEPARLESRISPSSSSWSASVSLRSPRAAPRPPSSRTPVSGEREVAQIRPKQGRLDEVTPPHLLGLDCLAFEPLPLGGDGGAAPRERAETGETSGPGNSPGGV